MHRLPHALRSDIPDMDIYKYLDHRIPGTFGLKGKSEFLIAVIIEKVR